MNITITEKYALFMLKEKKNLYGSEMPYLFMSMLVEMMLEGKVEITEKNQVIIKNKATTSYNEEFCDFICHMKKEVVYLKDIVTSITDGFSNKKLWNIIKLLQESMSAKELIVVEHKKGLLKEKEVITVNEESFTKIVAEVRDEFLDKDNLSEDGILLGTLLNASKILKNIFTKYEKEALNRRLREMKNTEIAEKVKIAQTAIDDMTLLITSIAIFTAMD